MSKRTLYGLLIVLGLIILAFFTTAFPLEAKYQHVSALFVIFFALPCYYGMVKSFGRKSAMLLICCMSIFAVILENFAIQTGFPYGRFAYGSLLGVTIGKVPWTVGFAWTPILFGAYAISEKIMPRVSTWKKNILTALLMTSVDLVIDPGSVRLGFWSWEKTVGFYNVPWSNFIGWFLTSLIGVLLLRFLIKQRELQSTELSPWMFSSYFLIVMYWTAICFFLQLWLAALAGLMVMLGWNIFKKGLYLGR